MDGLRSHPRGPKGVASGSKEAAWKSENNTEAKDHSLFPSFEMMSSSGREEAKPGAAAGRREAMEVDEWNVEPGEYARNIQKTLNFFRKAEGRCRRIEEEKHGPRPEVGQLPDTAAPGLHQGAKQVPRETCQAADRGGRDHVQAKDDALKELKAAFAPTARAKIPKDKDNEAEAVAELAQLLQNPDGEDEGGLAKVLLEAMHHGGLEDEGNRREILKALEKSGQEHCYEDTEPEATYLCDHHHATSGDKDRGATSMWRQSSRRRKRRSRTRAMVEFLPHMHLSPSTHKTQVEGPDNT